MKIVNDQKKTGATFTPPALADFLADRMLHYYQGVNENTCVLDPACGDGVLLLSMYEKAHIKPSNIIGYDTNATCLAVAANQIGKLSQSTDSRFYNEDFLSVCPNMPDFFNEKFKKEFADMIIANPPYVRTQVLGAEKAQQLSRDFGLSGRVDLYYPFFMAMTNALKVGGIIGVITSNRYICTKSGSDIRKYLLTNYHILEVIDLGDTKMFDAAVLPAIFIGIKKSSSDKTVVVSKYSSIYEAQKSVNKEKSYKSVFDILIADVPGVFNVGNTPYEYKSGSLMSDKSAIWQLVDEKTNAWISKVERAAAFRIKDRFKVRVGVKSCADNVFISQLWVKEGYEIEDKLLRPMLSQENIDTWNIDRDAIIKVIYPHYSENGTRKLFDITQYPKTQGYLEAHRTQLEGRKYLINSKRNWYEYWVPQNPELWKYPKVVFPDISAKPRFCFDKTGAVVNGNCYWICAQNKDEENLLLLIEGVCNSSVMTKYHDMKFTNKLYSGRRRYLSQYIKEYPIPDPNNYASRQIVRLVDRINKTSDCIEKRILASEVDNLVEEAFSLRD